MMKILLSRLAVALFAGFSASNTLGFDLEDYSTTFRATLSAYLNAVEDLRLAESRYKSVLAVGVANACELDYHMTGQSYETKEIIFSLKAGEHYSGLFETFQISEGQCETLFNCTQTDQVCRANRRACLASSVSANEIRVYERGNKALSEIISDYEATNLGQHAATADFAAMRAELDYVEANGEASSYANTALPTQADVLAELETELQNAGHDQSLIDLALSEGIALYESADSESAREDVCGFFNQQRDEHLKEFNEVTLAFPPMAAARAGWRAATEVYLSNESCSFLPNNNEPWVFD